MLVGLLATVDPTSTSDLADSASDSPIVIRRSEVKPPVVLTVPYGANTLSSLALRRVVSTKEGLYIAVARKDRREAVAFTILEG